MLFVLTFSIYFQFYQKHILQGHGEKSQRITNLSIGRDLKNYSVKGIQKLVQLSPNVGTFSQIPLQSFNIYMENSWQGANFLRALCVCGGGWGAGMTLLASSIYSSLPLQQQRKNIHCLQDAGRIPGNVPYTLHESLLFLVIILQN